MVLALTGPETGELATPELEMLSRSLMGTLLKLARERDLGAQVGGSSPRNRRTLGIQTCGGGGTGVQVWGWGCGSWVRRAATARFSLGNWGRMWVSCEGLLLTLDLPQRLAELLLDREPAPMLPETPARIPSEGASHTLALQLANAKAQLRRLRQEL